MATRITYKALADLAAMLNANYRVIQGAPQAGGRPRRYVLCEIIDGTSGHREISAYMTARNLYRFMIAA